MWTGEIYMGKLAKMDVVYDTGSDWLVVEGSDCTNCEGNTYDIGPSVDAGQAIAVSNEQSNRSYGSAELIGQEYTDTVCILFSACVEGFEFFLIESQRGISEPIDGIMGMSRNMPFYLDPEGGNITGPLYVEALANANVITENKFSFYFTEPGQISWVDLGEPVDTYIRDDANKTSLSMLDDYFWSAPCQGVSIGDPSDPLNQYKWENYEAYSNTIRQNAVYSVIDTGSSAMMISSVYYESLILKLFERLPDVQWSFSRGAVITSCDAAFPTLYFMLDSRWIEVDPADYVAMDPENQDQCFLFILPINLPINIFGMPLFVGYYTIHDPVAGTVEFAPHSTSTKSNLRTDALNTDQLLELSSGPSWEELNQSANLLAWGLTIVLCYLLVDIWYRDWLP